MKALVLSGGGSKGAFTGGMLEYMKMKKGKEYELYLGTSTGSLLQTLASINEFDKLKKAYTELTLEDIYDVSPFKKSSTVDNAKINVLSIIRMALFRKEPTFGDNTNLVRTIKKFFTEEDFEKVKDNGKILIPCVTNLTKAREEYRTSEELNYHEFIDWTWLSTNAVPFTSLVKRDGDYYADGGIMEHIPIRKAIEMGATEIDAISTKPEDWEVNEELDFGNNPIKLIEYLIDVMMWEMHKRDLDVAQHLAVEKDVTINIYYAPRNLTDNSMYFDSDAMDKWWGEGYEYAKNIFDKRKKKFKCKTIKIKAKK